MNTGLAQRRAVAAIVGLGMLFTAGCSGADVASEGDPVDNSDPRVDASRDEEPVLVYGSPPEVTWQQILPAFNERYPWITVETVDIQGPELVSRAQTELSSGSSTADLVIDFSDTFNELAPDLEQSSSRIEGDMSDSRLLAPGVYELEASPVFMMYNKELLEEGEVPTTWEGLLEFAEANPGELSTYSIGGPPSVPNVKSFLEQDPDAWDLLSELAPLVRPEEGGGPIITKTSQGQYSLAYAMTGLVRGATVDMGVDELLGFKLPTDVVTVMPRGIGVLAESESPNSAGLLMDFMLSEEGQELICKAGLTSTLPETADECGEYSLPNLLEDVDPSIVHYVEYSEEYFSDRDEIIDTWTAAQRG